ncbi:uncharacterized protein [Misgurnus anguillicaudatus]|uniref:uncharacterized protein isoform X2 n=1 Tax=Misgurnus anguillicaudatus TaxID=75329 RepID=UPI003CCF41BB
MIIRCSEMNFSFVLISGLIFSCFCSKVTCLYEEISVNQSPNNITVNESESAEISCCWTKTTFDVKVVWLKNERRVSGEPHVYQKSPVENCSTLHITNITPNDTGEYVCKVIQDIPILRHFIGSKTILTVIYKEQSTKTPTTTGNVTSSVTSSVRPPSIKKNVESSHLTLSLSLAAAVGLLTLCLIFTVCKMRNSCKKSDRVVIHQTPHSDGEEHENNESEELNSNSSRGSLQWYQVPVYWSYFDVQRDKEEADQAQAE